MKPLVKIIVLCVVAIVLVAMMVTIIKIGNKGFDSWFDFGVRTSYIYADDDKYSKGGGELEGKISKLDLSWVAGTVKIEEGEGDEIIISETSIEAIDNDYKLRYLLENETLTIKYCKSGYINFFRNVKSKNLTIKIPKQYLENMSNLRFDNVSADIDLCDITSDKVTINSVSGAINTNSLSGKELNVSTVSGKFTAGKLVFAKADISSTSGAVTIEDCTVDEKIEISTVSGGVKVNNGDIGTLDIETTSGKITVICSADEFECESVSGSIKAKFKNCPSNIDIESISGGCELIIADNDGFTANCDSVSGDLSIEGFATIKRGDNYIYKNGENKFNFDGVSGDFKIKLAD